VGAGGRDGVDPPKKAVAIGLHENGICKQRTQGRDRAGERRNYMREQGTVKKKRHGRNERGKRLAGGWSKAGQHMKGQTQGGRNSRAPSKGRKKWFRDCGGDKG